jgi:hypothetical protein
MSSTKIPVQGETTLLQRHAWIKRRAETRYHCGPATAGRLSKDSESQSQRAWILNLSATGIGLLLDGPLDVGAQLIIHLKSATTGAFFDLPARVVHATVQANGEWLIGCELAEKLGQDDLDALL